MVINNSRSPQLLFAGHSYFEPIVSPDGSMLAYICGEGEDHLLYLVTSDGAEEVLVSPELMKSRGFGFGGTLAWRSDSKGILFLNRSGSLYSVDLPTMRTTLLPLPGAAKELTPRATESAVGVILEDQTVLVVSLMQPNEWMMVPNVRRGALPYDFARSPSLSPSGRYLAWVEWSIPNMVWDATRVMVAEVKSGALSPRAIVGDDGFCYSQPAWREDGILVFISDRAGYLELWQFELELGDISKLSELNADLEEPGWSEGQRSYALSPDEVFVSCNQRGFGRLLSISLVDRSVKEVARGVFGSLSSHNHEVTALRSGPRSGEQLLSASSASSASSSKKTLRRGSILGSYGANEIEPSVVSWRNSKHLPSEQISPHGSDMELFGRLYRSESEKALIVIVHGGPTGQSRVVTNPKFSYLLDSGFSLFVPDYRGSTGHGRSYRKALDGGFLVLDVEDVASGTIAVVSSLDIAAKPVFLMGGSSGGATILALCRRFPDLFDAACTLYPLTDLGDLADTSSEFERYYFHSLIGEPQTHRQVYVERSPITFASELSVPLLVFQGARDEVVPAESTRAFINKALNVRYVEFDDEGHGWSKKENKIREISQAVEFFSSFL